MRKVKLNAAIFSPAALRTEGGKGEGKKGNFGEKEKWLWLSKGLGTSLKVSFRVFEGAEEGRGGGPLLALSLPPSLKMNPIEWERWSDAETARNKALTGPKQTPFCVTTNTYLGELTAGNSKRGGPPKMPSRLHPATPPTAPARALPAAPCVQLLHRWLESGATESLTRSVLLLLGEWLTEASTTS